MNLKDIVAISGMGGLFKVVARRPDGLIVNSFEEDKPKFVSNRIHIFTPLEGITLYTNTDNIELAKVLLEMKKQEAANKPLDAKESNQAHKDYFRKIVADFDEERVYVSDIKKVIKWYHLLDKDGLVVETAEEPTTADSDTAAAKGDDKAKKTAKPKPDGTKAAVKKPGAAKTTATKPPTTVSKRGG
jgi:hypothetical protein